jgi:hypothetical protein
MEEVTMSTVIGLFQHEENVQSSLDQLHRAGFAEDNISVLTRNDEVQKLLDTPQNHRVMPQCALCGALMGFALFGLVSLFRIVCQCIAAPTGFEFYVFTFVFLTILGAIFGAIFGSFVGADALERNTQLYRRGVCCGYPVMAVKASGEKVAKAIDLLREEKAVGVKIIPDLEAVREVKQ